MPGEVSLAALRVSHHASSPMAYHSSPTILRLSSSEGFGAGAAGTPEGDPGAGGEEPGCCCFCGGGDAAPDGFWDEGEEAGGLLLLLLLLLVEVVDGAGAGEEEAEDEFLRDPPAPLPRSFCWCRGCRSPAIGERAW